MNILAHLSGVLLRLTAGKTLLELVVVLNIASPECVCAPQQDITRNDAGEEE